jgi:hypothetical protein
MKETAFCVKYNINYAAYLKKFSKFPCCLNPYNEFLGTFSYVHSHMYIQSLKGLRQCLLFTASGYTKTSTGQPIVLH